MPKINDESGKLGKMRFVFKGNNPNANNQRGIIVSFIPFNSFTGDINLITTYNFRSMQFTGIILFDKLDGCTDNAYLVFKGVVVKKLEKKNNNLISERGYCPYNVDWYQQSYTNNLAVGDPVYLGSGTQWVYCPTDPFGYGISYPNSYDAAMQQYPNGTGGASNNSGNSDPTYSDYLAQQEYICPSNFEFKSISTNSMTQQAAVSDIKTIISLSSTQKIEVKLGTLYFLAPTTNMNGISASDAARKAANALNKAESTIRDLTNSNYAKKSCIIMRPIKKRA